MIAELIEADLKAEIAKAGREIVDPKALAAWMTEAGIGRSAMSAATGADYQAVTDKQRAGNPHRHTSDAEYSRLSLPLTPEYYPGSATVWENWKPQKVMIERLSAALEDVVSVMYARYLGHWPEAADRAWYEGQIADGRPEWEIVQEIAGSKEVIARR